jgi:hypothetical protein
VLKSLGGGHLVRAIDFDAIDEWYPELTTTLSGLCSDSFVGDLRRAESTGGGASFDVLHDLPERELFVDRTMAWLRESTLAAYHGCRLTEAELQSVCSGGLVPLNARVRRSRIADVLSVHPD